MARKNTADIHSDSDKKAAGTVKKGSAKSFTVSVDPIASSTAGKAAKSKKTSSADASTKKNSKGASPKISDDPFSAIIQVDEATKNLMNDIQKGITCDITAPVNLMSAKLNKLSDDVEEAVRAAKNASIDAGLAKESAVSADNKADDIQTVIMKLISDVKTLAGEQKEIKQLLTDNNAKLDAVLAKLNLK
jgi:hypothetical protein